MSARVTLEQLAERIDNVSVESRRPDKHWLRRWRARGSASANGPTITTWGDRMEDAVLELADKIDREQAAKRPS